MLDNSRLILMKLSAAAKAEVKAEVDNALDTAIPVGATADSINERIKAIDVALEAGVGLSIKNIQQGTINFTGSSSATATVTAYVLANSFLILNGIETTISGADADRTHVRIEKTNTTTITATKGSALGTGTLKAGFTLVEFA